MGRGIKHFFAAICLGSVLGSNCAAEVQTRRLTLPEAVALALRQNKQLKIERFKVLESDARTSIARSSYYPEIKNQSSVAHSTAVTSIDIPAGAFGVYPNTGLIPHSDVLISQGGLTLVTSGTTIAQPLTQLVRIREGNRIAQAEAASSRDELREAENKIALQVHVLYFGILTATLLEQAAEHQVNAARSSLQESENAILGGTAMKVTALQGQASLLESEQTSLSARLHLTDLTTEMNDLLGLPLDTALDMAAVAPMAGDLPERSDYEKAAWDTNPGIASAVETVRKAKAGVREAKSAYIPDISVFARHSYQNGVPFLLHNFGTFGAQLSYDVFDFGKRRARDGSPAGGTTGPTRGRGGALERASKRGTRSQL